MAEKLPPDELEAARKHFLQGSEAALLSHMGFYLMWFGIVEVWLTTSLAAILKLTPLQAAEIVMRGMDARVKCDRLRQATKQYSPIGPNLSKRLTYFENQSIPLRHRIAHTWPMLEGGVVHFSTMGRMHGSETHTDFPPPSIHLDDLMCEALWLNLFAGDLQVALYTLIDGKPFEVVDPKSSQQ